MRPIIRAENISKLYRIGARRERRPTLRDSITRAFRSPLGRFRRNGNSETTVWALNGVSFEVAPGEVVGIIGRNGAGKSTLLKILSRITHPTTGQVDIYGRIGSLLEVGTGFHSELSGRENIYLNGAILGMRRNEIGRKFDEIVGFAEVEEFIDTPVKHYSSGMYMRLAFAVAAHLDPEILLVDEVLAVGDASFQKKCLGKMQEVGEGGRTVLFVSHNMAAVQNLCRRVILIGRGRVDYDGETNAGIDRYMATSIEASCDEVDLVSHPTRRSGCPPLLRAVRLLDGAGASKAQFSPSENMTIELRVAPVATLNDPYFDIGVDDNMGVRIFSLATYLSDVELSALKQPSRVMCHLDQLSLAPGRYHLSLCVGTSQNAVIDTIENAVSFEVVADDFFGNGRIMPAGFGKVMVRSRWEAIPLN
jgi:lipopolysaccharide transport system ATP-binding protein